MRAFSAIMLCCLPLATVSHAEETQAVLQDLDVAKLFDAELSRIAAKFRVSSSVLKEVLLFETAGTLDPSIRNSRSGAVGLIQFTAAVAESLGTSLDELATMSALEQLLYVEKYLDRTPLTDVPSPTISDVYLAVLAPRYVKAQPATVIYSRRTSERAYVQNREFDTDGNGDITRREIEDALMRFAEGKRPLEVVAEGNEDGEGFFDISVNGALTGESVYLYTSSDGTQYIAKEDFDRLGFAKSIDAVDLNGARVVPLTAENGARLIVNVDESAAALTVPANWYSASNLDLSGRSGIGILEPEPGTYANYSFNVDGSLSGDYAAYAGASITNHSPMGIFHSDFGFGWDSEDELRSSRGETYFLRENAAKRTFVRIGDGVAASGPGVTARHFAGVSYGSDLELDPTYNPYLSYGYSGEALLPTSVEFLKDGKRIGSRVDLRPGPFTLNNLPVVDGSGDLTILMTDSLGRKSEVTLPYLRSSKLYKQGSRSFNYSAGVERKGSYEYEIDSPFIAASHRWGLNDRITVSDAISADLNQVKGGVGIATTLLDRLIVEPYVALGLSADGLGYSFGARLSPLGSVFGTSFGIAADFSSSAYDGANVGDDSHQRLSASAYVGRNVDGIGQLGAFATYRDEWGGRSDIYAGVNLSRNIWEGVSADATLSYNSSGLAAMFGLQFALPKDAGYVTAQAISENGGLYTRGDYVRQQPSGKGVGYRMGAYRTTEATSDDLYQADGEITASTPYGQHAASAVLRDGDLHLRGRTAGSVGITGGNIFAAPPVSGAVAIVDAGGLEGVPVYRYNNDVGRTDASGKLIVTNIATNSPTDLKIKSEDLPFDYLSTTTEKRFVIRGPGFYRVDFGVSRQRPAIVSLKDETGVEIGTGAVVMVAGTDATAYVGLRGEAFFEDLPYKSVLKVDVGDQTCEVVIDYEATSDPQPLLGPYICKLGVPQGASSSSDPQASIY